MVQKRGCRANAPIGRILFQSISSPQGGQRPIINSEPICSEATLQDGGHSQSEGQPGDWLGKADLKDAFFTIPIHAHCRQYLGFMFQGKAYQFTCLSFRLSSAPWIFTKTLKPALALLQHKGMRLIAYMDDILSLAESRNMFVDHLTKTVRLLENLGL